MNTLKKIGLVIIALFNTLNIFSQNPNDCIDAIITCGNSDVNLDVSGSGNREFPNSCSSNETNSVWLHVTVIDGGTLGFTLTPESTNIDEDYDFFIFGPNVPCDNLGPTIRCSTTNPRAANQMNNLTGLNVSSNDTFEGPGPNGDSFVRWLDVNAGDTYFIVIDRPIGNSAFNLEWTGTARFADPPSDASNNANNPINLERCDVTTPFDDGLTAFNIADNTPLITGSQTDVNITYHLSESDANIGINELSSPYTNISNPQTIYARITNVVTGCFEITDFDLNTNLGPNIIPPTDLMECDTALDGNDRNGQTNFTLSQKNTEILNGLNETDYNISYHVSEMDAENSISSLPNVYYNAVAFNQQIYVRVENISNTNCRSIVPLNLVVNPTPIVFDHIILQCDEDGIEDGLTLFNLNQANENLTGGERDLSTRFYTDLLRTNQVNGDSFSNTSNSQTIYVEVFNTITGCLSLSELTLQVSLTNSNNTTLIECDDDGTEDGFFSFNLRNADNEITNGLPAGLDIAYYQTYQDALLEINNLGDSFTNNIPYLQTIYARVENTNNCYGISEIELAVNVLPDIEPQILEYYCLNTFPATITLNAGLINDSPNNYSYNWLSGEDTYQINVNELGSYEVIVTNSNGCSKNRIITVEASNIATVNDIKVSDASQNNTISAITSGEGTYQYQLLDENNQVYAPYQDSNTFENVFPGIYTITIKDIKNDCGIVDELISVIGFPKFFTPNNDGNNDTWQIKGVSRMFQPNTKIQIFDRYGKLIKEISPLGKGWDGLINGARLPTDDYWFKVTLQDGRIFRDHFTLKY